MTECQSAWMSRITNDGLTWSDTGRYSCTNMATVSVKGFKTCTLKNVVSVCASSSFSKMILFHCDVSAKNAHVPLRININDCYNENHQTTTALEWFSCLYQTCFGLSFRTVLALAYSNHWTRHSRNRNQQNCKDNCTTMPRLHCILTSVK